MFYYFFFFKQKTAYEMRISDWSSDVCSSDLSMSIRIMAKVWERAIEPLPKMILLCLADYANDQGGEIFPTIATVRAAVGAASETEVRRCMGQFRHLGVLVQEPPGPGPRLWEIGRAHV